ncbi:DDE-type integrase/transposase/recombinase [Flavobacterium ustbae]|uniref:DDE-type integrase/transposase/recombinase n=1 Tax=Flavobacterium ustbae TaxID=2488790 RepID=UPI0019D273B2
MNWCKFTPNKIKYKKILSKTCIPKSALAFTCKKGINCVLFSKIKIRECKYLNNIVEQDHRFIKWRIQNRLGYKSFESAKRTLSGIEVVHILKKNQMVGRGISIFKSFFKLASSFIQLHGLTA